jgi:hypothetical protein
MSDSIALLSFIYSGISVHESLSSRTNRLTDKFSEQNTSRVTNGVSSNEHASRQQRLTTSWEYRRESVSWCVTFAHYTSLLEFAVPSLEFRCVLCFFNILSNKTQWDQRRINKQSSGVKEQINSFYIVSYGKNIFGLRTFRVTNGVKERIKFVNRGSTVLSSDVFKAYILNAGLHVVVLRHRGYFFLFYAIC